MKNISIVITSIARDSLLRAIRSIFSQDYPGNIQICIGINKDVYGNADKYKQIILNECPKTVLFCGRILVIQLLFVMEACMVVNSVVHFVQL